MSWVDEEENEEQVFRGGRGGGERGENGLDSKVDGTSRYRNGDRSGSVWERR